MNKGLIGIGALIVMAVAGVVVWFQWGQHIEITGKITAVRLHGVTPTDTVAVVDCELVNPADVPFEVEDVEAVAQPATGEAVTGSSVAAVDIPRLVAAYPALQGVTERPTLKMRDAVAPRTTTRRSIMFQFAGLSAADFAARKSVTVRIRERLGSVGEVKEAR